ncbi:carbon-nitrogen hydrolase [Leptodontidium sp. MPI-SDFR-AT-0119]|nr:carbon-nitrogen hydrolase [Leptodontidium sp. MPI-SDFR-AT-0119]
MRIACLQFAPQGGDVRNNLDCADAVLSRANPQNLDLLVLPELAFTGYNFQSLAQISPFLEPTTAGITSLWARVTALKYNCVVTTEYYNSAVTINADGETIANYRKSFLYNTDETWALEGPDGFYDGEINGLGTVAMGAFLLQQGLNTTYNTWLGIDLNPYKFGVPLIAWEFAQHVLRREVNLVVLSMAWMTREDTRPFSGEPDMESLSYWLALLEPLIRNDGEDEIIAVFANRTGIEGNATYAGTSAVLGIQAGEVKVYGILGRGERELLVVDTAARPTMQLVCGPKAETPSNCSSDSDSDSDQSLKSALSIQSSQYNYLYNVI